ncbi:MAG: LacI family DNA-binding transcriptional regulator [Sedimentisphaeraceae bacterium JB056]
MQTEVSNKSVSIVSIAEEVGVSKTTVGYVLSGQAKKRRVADSTAKKVLQAAKRLNYVPHLWARNLAKQSTGVVGLIVAGYEYNWMTEVMNGLVPILEEEDLIPMSSIHLWDAERNERELNISQQRRDEGLICQPLPECLDTYKGLVSSGTPLLFISDTLEAMPDVSFVAWDCLPAAKVAVEHLVETGRKNIGFIGSSLIDLKFSKRRFDVYWQVLHDAGLELNDSWVNWSNLSQLVRRQGIIESSGLSGEVEISAMVKRIFSSNRKKPDALFFPHDSLALQVYKVLLSMGIRVPDDVALVGMGDVPLSDSFGVGLTTVREPLEQIGKAAAETIIELVKNPGSKPIQKLIPGSELKIRRTSN